MKIEKEHELAAADIDNYLTNPVNAYKLIKRLYIDWQKYEEHFLKDHKGKGKFLRRFIGHNLC